MVDYAAFMWSSKKQRQQLEHLLHLGKRTQTLGLEFLARLSDLIIKKHHQHGSEVDVSVNWPYAHPLYL